MYKKISAPIMVQWEITPVCNHNCVHCYNYWRQDLVQKLPTNFNLLFDLISKELVKNKVFSVIITGGEPLTVIEDVVNYIKFLSNNGVWVTLNSNLALLTSEKVTLLKQCGIKSILVSLPSADPKTNDLITNSSGSFFKITEGILMAKESGFPISINMVISKLNMHQISKTAEFVASMGLKNFAVTRASDPSSNKEFYNQLLNLEEFRLMQKELDEVGKKLNLKTDSLEANPACSYGNYVPSQGYKFCCAGKSTCTVGFNGDIRPCNRSIMTYGNIKDGLLNSWNKMDDWRSDNWLPNECLICNFKYQCNGGCKADAIKTFGDPQRPDPLCDFSSISLLNQKENIALKLIEKKQFKINPKLKTRKEKFGGILYVQLNKWTPVSVQLFNLFLQNKESMSVDEIGKILSVDSQKAAETATFLFNKQILL